MDNLNLNYPPIQLHFLYIYDFRAMIMFKGPAILILIFLKSSIYAQMDAGMGDYDTESGSEWGPKQFLISLTQMCHNDCSQKCLSDCPQPKLCKDDQFACGKKEFAHGEWLDCPKDDICVPNGCECKIIMNYATTNILLIIQTYFF